jgi:hypothetical protein
MSQACGYLEEERDSFHLTLKIVSRERKGSNVFPKTKHEPSRRHVYTFIREER